MKRCTGLQIPIINRENLQWLIDSSWIPFDYDMVIIDELSSFKNHKSQRFKSLMKVRPRLHRIIGLTGTPSFNGLMDLWAEFKVLDMGERLGRFITQYRTNYFMPDKRNGEITAANAAALTGKLCQLANGAIYANTGDIIEFHDRKLDTLEDIIEAANEKPLLVAYWFRHDLSRIKKRFHVQEIKTSRDIADWNAIPSELLDEILALKPVFDEGYYEEMLDALQERV